MKQQLVDSKDKRGQTSSSAAEPAEITVPKDPLVIPKVSIDNEKVRLRMEQADTSIRRIRDSLALKFNENIVDDNVSSPADSADDSDKEAPAYDIDEETREDQVEVTIVLLLHLLID